MFPSMSRLVSTSTRALSCLTISCKSPGIVAGRKLHQHLQQDWPKLSGFHSAQPAWSAYRQYSEEHTPQLPVITHRPLTHFDPDPWTEIPQAWLESLRSVEDNKLGLVDLHPDVFATFPRVDILHQNVVWQKNYKRISMALAKTRAELRGGGRKPWRQKGTGRARHGSRRSPIWIKGGKSHGPRGPKSYWYVLPTKTRAQGLRVALTVKYTQDDLHIVDTLDIPSSSPQYLQDLCKERYWGESVLFVDNKPLEEMPMNFLEAVNGIKTFNVLSAEGLNVWSMLKHKTLILTLDTVELLERRLLHHLHSYGDPILNKNLPIMNAQLGMDPSWDAAKRKQWFAAQETEV
ncbi:large ribosomal subunit protein uL4m-like [Diadema setosum]|uniref:large ribosomal subunit protein uL4m-like n=1 Tax=Diadema setosum TaxID=31175 RepID=UPI003B3B24D2